MANIYVTIEHEIKELVNDFDKIRDVIKNLEKIEKEEEHKYLPKLRKDVEEMYKLVEQEHKKFEDVIKKYYNVRHKYRNNPTEYWNILVKRQLLSKLEEIQRKIEHEFANKFKKLEKDFNNNRDKLREDLSKYYTELHRLHKLIARIDDITTRMQRYSRYIFNNNTKKLIESIKKKADNLINQVWSLEKFELYEQNIVMTINERFSKIDSEKEQLLGKLHKIINFEENFKKWFKNKFGKDPEIERIVDSFDYNIMSLDQEVTNTFNNLKSEINDLKAFLQEGIKLYVDKWFIRDLENLLKNIEKVVKVLSRQV